MGVTFLKEISTLYFLLLSQNFFIPLHSTTIKFYIVAKLALNFTHQCVTCRPMLYSMICISDISVAKFSVLVHNVTYVCYYLQIIFFQQVLYNELKGIDCLFLNTVLLCLGLYLFLLSLNIVFSVLIFLYLTLYPPPSSFYFLFHFFSLSLSLSLILIPIFFILASLCLLILLSFIYLFFTFFPFPSPFLSSGLALSALLPFNPALRLFY